MQKQTVLLKLFFGFIFVILIQFKSHAQTGLNFQGVARTTNNVIIASQQISLRLSILQGSAMGNVEYSETRKATTNAQGLFSVVIGDADATNTLGSFTTINWKNTPKYLKIEMDASAGSNFSVMGTTQFQYVAYAQFASSVDAENIAGVVPVAKGGTGVSSLAALKTSLVLDKINNTADADKPISTKTQTALDLKLNAADSSKYAKQDVVDAALKSKFNVVDTIKYTKQAFVETSLATKLNLSDTANMLSNRIGRDTLNLSARINAITNTTEFAAGLAGKVDKVIGKALSTNDYTNAEKTKLAAISGINTGDQDLSIYATNTSLALKANSTDVAISLSSKLNKVDTASLLQKADTITLSNRIDLKANLTDQIASLALKANATELVTGLSGKVDKVIGKALSTNDYTNAEKTKLAAISGTNTGDETEASIKSKLGVTGFFSGAYADLTNKPDLTLKENANNKSINFNDDSTSDIKFPSVKAVKGFVDANNASLLNGVVSLTKDQNIGGEKTFNNDLIMGNIGGVAGTSSPTIIKFANGSKIGNIQEIDQGVIDDIGSIDLYAPDGAKWVQMNYGNTNYIALNNFGARFYVGDLEWNFLFYGETELPGDLAFKNPEGSYIKSDYLLDISSSDVLRLSHDSDNSYTGMGLYEDEVKLLIEHGDVANEWKYKLDGSSWLPGDLNVSENHSINFINTNTSSTSSSIYASGPYLKLNTRAATQTEIDEEEIAWGLELDYGNKNSIIMNEYGINLRINPATDLNLNQSNVYLNNTKFLLDLANNTDYTQKNWIFNGEDGSTVLPGKLAVAQKSNDDFGLTITSPSPVKGQGIDLDKLGSSIGFISNLDAGTISNTAFIQLNPRGDLIFRTKQGGMFFENYGQSDVQFKFKKDAYEDPDHPENNTPEIIKSTMSIGKDNVYIDGTLTVGGINYPKLKGTAGQVLTIDSDSTYGFNAIWVTPTNTQSSTTGIASINGIASGTHSLTVGVAGNLTIDNTSDGDHVFNIPNARTSGVSGGLLSNADWNTFNNKQDVITNVITGTSTGTLTRSSGLISLFDGANSITGDPNLYWDATNKRLGIGTNLPTSPLEVMQGSEDEFGISITSPPRSANHAYGSSIGFESNVGGSPNSYKGSFQLDADGSMVFRTMQGGMYFDNAGSGSMIFRMGDPRANIGMSLNNSGNLEVAGTLKTGSVIYPKIAGQEGDVLTFESGTNKAVWKAPTANTSVTNNIDASTLSGTTLNATITASSLTSVGILNDATVNGKVIVGASAEASSAAILEASSTSKGFLPPRMSYYQRTQIASPVAGLTVWCNNCGASGEMQVFNGGSWTNMIGGAVSSPTSVSIGDNYQGGKVAYILQSGDLGYDPNTQHGIIAATSDQSTGIYWFNGSYTTTGATASAIGFGLVNTNKIIESQGATLTDYAAGLAKSYNGGGYNDWYLPSKYELLILYQKRAVIGGFSSSSYWSSTENSSGDAAAVIFWDGLQTNFTKFGSCRVRAIRSF